MDMEPSAEEEDMEYAGLGDEGANAFDSFTDDEEEDEDLYGDITPELSGDINESINTTLSKYFE
jgi:hypothetical protein